MGKICWTSRARWSALIAVIAVTLCGIPALQPTTASAARARAASTGSCRFSTARRLATTLWRDPVSGTELTATLFGSYEGSHFCGDLYAEADLTLPAGYDAEWTCADLFPGGSSACGELGPGPATGQQTFFIASHDRREDCDGVDVSIQGFFIADVSIPHVCG